MKQVAILLLVVFSVADPHTQRSELAVERSTSHDASGERWHSDGSLHELAIRGTTTVVPNEDYKASVVWQWLFGRYYRDVWATPVEVQIIDLEKTAGGLSPIERGGGNQTSSLHLEGADGRQYELRSVNKDVRGTIPGRFRGTLVGRLIQDQISSLNPFASMVVAPLARAAGILHLEPVLVVIPDSPRLGPFRGEFAGMLAQFERDPDEDQSDAARFGYSRNLVGTTKLLEELGDDSSDRVDARAYARARLFDMLIGDWDRHERQWRWAEYESDHGTLYVPVPTDRDGAFSKFDGLMSRMARRSGRMVYRRLVDFDENVPDVFGLNWQGYRLDRRLAASLTRDDWTHIADSLKSVLTDEAVDGAVRFWPDSVFRLIGPMTARALKSRRDDLTSIASSYYDFLSDTVDVYGSDADERFEVTRLSDDETRVVLRQSAPDGGPGRVLYSRVFRRDETDEIRLFGHGGNDRIILYGKAGVEPLVRIKGGTRTTAFVDSSAFEHPFGKPLSIQAD